MCSAKLSVISALHFMIMVVADYTSTTH